MILENAFGRWKSGAFRRANVTTAIAGIGAIVLALYPMLWHLYLPLVDIPNHIARFAVMSRPDGPLGTYYFVASNLVTPNSAVDLLWWMTGMQGDPVVFARATMMIYAANLILSVMILSRVATGRWSAWSAVAGLLVYNGSFIWGFQNYVFSVPFSLHALSIWLAMEHRSAVLRAAVFLPICVLLFLMHLLAFGVLASAVLGREAHRLLASGSAWRHQLVVTIISGIPFLLPLLWYVYQAISQPVGALGSRTDFGNWSTRLRALLSVQWEAPLSEYPAFLLSGSAVLIVLTICFLSVFRKTGPRLRIAHVLKGPIVALFILSILAPAWLNGVALTQIRFPFLTVAVLIAGSSWVDVRLQHKIILTLLFTGLFVQKSVQFERLWAVHNAEMRDLRTVLSVIPPGSRLLPLRAPGNEMMRRLWHAQAYATTYNDVFVPTFFQGTHAVELRDEWSSYAAIAFAPLNAQRVFSPDANNTPLENAYLANNYWKNWDEKFTHVLFLEDVSIPEHIRVVLNELKSSGRFKLLEIRSPDKS